MRAVVFTLLFLACAGQARRLQSRRENLRAEKHSRYSQTSRRVELHKSLKALALFLSEINPASAFNTFVPGNTAAYPVPPDWHLLERSHMAVCMTDGPPLRWEDARSGTINVSALEEGCEVDTPAPKFPRLHQVEYEALTHIQRVPGLLRFSLIVHFSLLPKVITPLLALIVWLSSLPKGASLIIYVCASDCLNTAIKWAVQRPRPRWYCPIRANSLISSCGAWEVDLSFPSAHTMFFSGLASCGSVLYGFPLWCATLFGASIGITRNYLSMHWPTDTFFGVVFGTVLGLVWGAVDPYARVLSAGSPFLSLCAATLFAFGLIALMSATRQAVPPVTSLERTFWFNNALCSVSPEERKSVLANRKKQLRPRSIKSKVPMIVTVWATLAITGLYPFLLPHAALEPSGSLMRRFVQAFIGVVGLSGVGALKKFVGDSLAEKLNRSKRGLNVKASLKALTYLTICAWTFLVSQIVGGWLLDTIGLL